MSRQIEVKGNDGVSAFIDFDVITGKLGGKSQFVKQPDIPGYCSGFLRECEIEDDFSFNVIIPFKGSFIKRLFIFSNAFAGKEMPLINDVGHLSNIRRILPAEVVELLCPENPKADELAKFVVLTELADYLMMGDAVHLFSLWAAFISENVYLSLKDEKFEKEFQEKLQEYR